MKSFLILPLLLIAFALASCDTVVSGTVVGKGSRAGLVPRPTDVYWVEVEGVTRRGREVRQDVFVFFEDYRAARIGDSYPLPPAPRDRMFGPQVHTLSHDYHLRHPGPLHHGRTTLQSILREF